MQRRLSARIERLPLRRPFAISRGRKDVAEVVVAEIAEGGHIGRGECVPYPRYGETPADVLGVLECLTDAVAAGLTRSDLESRLPPGAARNALDCALWDLDAKCLGRRVWDLVGSPAPSHVVCAETVGLDAPNTMAREAAMLADRPLIKVKLGATDIAACVAAVRSAAPAARLIVDANEAWTPDILAAEAPALAAFGVELIEQPLPAGADAALAETSCPVPVCADESCHTTQDLERLRGCYAFVNIKLDKAGGLTEALRMATAARDLGFGIMVGCMVASSLAMAPALVLAGMADYADLDGPLWLAADRTPSLRFDNGMIDPPPAELWG